MFLNKLQTTGSRLFLAILGTAIYCLLPVMPLLEAKDRQPNVVLFFIDDMGWTDLGCFGSKYYKTPNVDKLRSSGLKFTAAYSGGPNCAPTRACLMSGQYTPRHGIYTVGSGARGQAANRELVPVENRTKLDPSVVTVAESLRSVGYSTAHLGKWHLGTPGLGGPEDQGFDLNVGGAARGHPPTYFSPYRNKQLKNGPKGEYLTDRLTDEALRFIDDSKAKPFFLYFAHYAVHTPIQAKADITARYQSRPAVGGHGNAKYAAMIESVDQSVGRIMKRLESLDLADDTVVFFYSDNGGLGGYARSGAKGAKDITDNAPLRGGKGMLYEGGIRVPLIASWPGVIEAGTTTDLSVTTVDFYPTLLEIAGAKRPDQTLDGQSFVPILRSEKTGVFSDRAIYWHFPGYLQAGRGHWRTTPGSVIREGNYKLIEFFESGAVELYDLSKDIGENENLLSKDPVRAMSMLGKLRGWRREVDAPLPLRRTDLNEKPLLRAHAHNDYEHERPLIDALSHGFCSVEADVFAIDGELLVAHDRKDIRPERTLRRLYLDPLLKRVRMNGGKVHAGGPEFTLHIDFKTSGEETYKVLRSQLPAYREMLTRVEKGKVTRGPVSIIISGSRPWSLIAAQDLRYVGVDGRLSDLDGNKPASLMPLVSDNWRNHFSWRGLGPMAESERLKLRKIISTAHSKGWKVRFWATPESEAMWTELNAAGADFINTDELARLRSFLLRTAASSESE